MKGTIMKKCFLCVLVNMLVLSLVLGQEQPKDNQFSFKNIQRNSVFIEIFGLGGMASVNYERCVPAGNKTGFGFRIGAGAATTLTTMVETNFLYGKNKRFFETGIGFANAFVEDETEQWITVKLGYRYQAKKGFLFKVAPMYVYTFEDLDFDGFWLGAALGYSF